MGDEGGELSGEVAALDLVIERTLGGGVGSALVNEELKKVSFSERPVFGAGADGRRGVASVSSSVGSRDDG